MKTIFFIWSIALSSAVSAKQEFLCPPKIQLRSVAIVEQQENSGYSTSISKAPQWLSGASVFDGNPQGDDSLKPTQIQRTGDIEISIWKFEGPYTEEKWLSCDYLGGTVKLSARLENGIKYCRATTHVQVKPRKLNIKFGCE